MVLCVWFLLVVNTSASDCLERLVPEMINYVLRGMLNSYSLTLCVLHLFCCRSALFLVIYTVKQLYLCTCETLLCCVESQQSVISADDQQVAAAADLYVSQQLDSEPMVIDSCPIQCTTSQSVSYDSSIKPFTSNEVSLVDAGMPSVPTDVNFNSSSNHTSYISGDEVYVDLSSSLHRPALFNRTGSEVVDSISHVHETVAADAGIEHSDAVSVDDDVQSSHDEVSTYDEVPAVDEAFSSDYHSACINDTYSIHHDVVFTSGADLNSHDYRCSASNSDTAAADEEVCGSSRDTVSVLVTVSSDANVVSNGHDAVSADGVVAAVGKASPCSHVIDDEQRETENDEVVYTGPGDTNATRAAVDSAAVAMETNTELLKRDVYMDNNDDLSSEQLDVDDVAPAPDMFWLPNAEKFEGEMAAGASEPQYTELVLENADMQSVDAVLSDVSCGRLSLPDQLTSEIAAEEDSSTDDQNKDLNREMMDVVDNQSDVLTASEMLSQPDTATSPSGVAVDRLQQDIGADEKQKLTEKVEVESGSAGNIGDAEQSTKSPTSTSWLCL